jgi:hypothetical protein
MWGSYRNLGRDQAGWRQTDQNPKTWDPHLRSTTSVTGHHVQAMDGEIGHIEDFILDEDFWAIRYLVVNTKNWLPGKHVLVSPRWIERVSWSESKVFVNLSQEAIRKSPEFTIHSLLTREYEVGLHRHYDRYGYWFEELEVGNKSGL